MNFNADEILNLKAMLLFLITKKQKESDNHCGFHLNELKPILDDMVDNGEIEERPTINKQMYFLKNGTKFHN